MQARFGRDTAVMPTGAEVLGTSVQEVNPEPTGRAGAEVVTLEAAMTVAAIGAEKKGRKRRLAPAVMLGLLGASLLASCAPVGTQTVEPGVTIVSTAAATEVQGGVVIASTEEPTERPEVVEVMATEVPTETPEPTAEPTATPEPEMGMQNEQGQWWDGAGWQSLPEGEGWQVEVLEDGQVQATDTSGANYTWVEGKWLTEAQIETQKVVEYVAANSEVINRVPMEHVEFRASEALQRQIYDRLPADLQTQLGEHPLYMMVWNAPKMQEVLSGLSIEVEGYKDKLSLADHKLVVTFMNFNEDIEGVWLDHFHGGASDSFVYGAYLDETTGEIHLVMRTARFTSVGYRYDQISEGAIIGQGAIPAIALLAGFNDAGGVLGSRLSEDTSFDDSNIAEEQGVTWFLHAGVGNPYREYAIDYANIGYYQILYEEGWIPEEVWGMMQ